MLFIVTLSDRRPAAELDPHRDAHRAWLSAHTQAGRVLAAGPLDAEIGGLILAHGDSRAALDALLATDPFVVHGLVDVAVQACRPALRHAEFPHRWAPAAGAVAER